MDIEERNFTTITSFNMEEGVRGKKKEPKMSRGTTECNLKLRIFITIFWLCVIALAEYLFIWKFFPELQGDIVGRVRIKITVDNLNYTADLANINSARYKNLSEEFISQVDQRWKNSTLMEFYTRTEIDGFENGSVIIKFSSIFKQKSRMLPLQSRIEDVLQSYIFTAKFNITLESISIVAKSKPEIISYDLVRDTLVTTETPSTLTSANMAQSTPTSANMTPSTPTSTNMTSTPTSTNITPSTPTSENMTPSTSTSANTTPSTPTSANMTPSTPTSVNMTLTASPAAI
ncbi:hypothetical protein ACJMK2_033984 [Sinanodonta woodiana]|uniref:SEA domain-containing protein n=1 Tax=Sinanodonta woodiana TaxID=1069815 RepID=A0ABD3WRM3_SINWO